MTKLVRFQKGIQQQVYVEESSDYEANRKKSTYHCRVSHLKNVIRDLAFVPPRINSFQVCVFMVGD